MFNGLTEAEVEESRRLHGSNEIPDSEPTTFWQEFKASFNDPMIRILLCIAALMIGMWAIGQSEIYEPIGTITAILIVAFVSAKTGVASDTKYRELKESTRHDMCRVYRAGELRTIDVDDVVVGDKVLLCAGDKIPADGVLVEGTLRVNNASLNGEVEECPKRCAPVETEFPAEITGDTLTDDHTLFRGTVLYDGDGVLDVRRVGIGTMMGRMAAEMNAEEPDSPLKVKLSRLAHQISVFGYIGASVITLLYMGYLVMRAGGPAAYFDRGMASVVRGIVHAVSLGIVIVVCAVPEGLPLMISLVLMQNTSKMLDHNVLVRTAIGIETSGSLNILFSDKTGTITRGVLEVTELFSADGAPVSKEHPLICAAIAKNTQSSFDASHNVVGGNLTDRALVGYLGEELFRRTAEDESIVITDHQGFNSANKFSQVETTGAGARTFYKGAPEVLMRGAKRYLAPDGQIRDIDAAKLNAKIDELAARAMRVIAFACSDSPMTPDRVNDDAVITALAAIRDDVRPEARDAIQDVLAAGIQVVMITGDRLETALAIGREAGLVASGDDLVLTSAQIAEMSDDEIKSVIRRVRVIARALPTDKSRMVRICQEMNLVVGMTGDGVNDSPSLSRADVGFAMGSGTEAAKEAGEIIILDDNFRSIKDAIWYGRTIYHNILKFCKFQLAINVSAVAVSALAPFLGVEEPLKVTHLLFVNLVMDSLGALMFGGEPALDVYMKERPRRRDESLISAAMMGQILIAGAWITIVSFIFLKHPFFIQFFDSEPKHLTAYFVLFILFALMNGFNVRSDSADLLTGLSKNLGFIRVMLCIIGVQALIVNASAIPGKIFDTIGQMFSCTPFKAEGWLLALVIALSIIPADLVRKLLSRR